MSTPVRRGQIWVSKDGRRRIQVERVDERWEDVIYLNLANKRRGAIFVHNLLRLYQQDAPPSPLGR